MMEKGNEVLSQFWEIFQKKILLESSVQKTLLKGYSPTEIHCIQYVGSHPHSNVTKLAEAFRMTTGGVTKLTQKLTAKDLLEPYKNSNNRKEIYFRLTPQGQELYDIHKKLNEEFEQRDRSVFLQITEEDYDCLLHFAGVYNRHLDAELKKAEISLPSDLTNKF